MGFGKSGESARRVMLVAAMAIVMLALLFGTATALKAEADPGREIEAKYGVWHNDAALQRVTVIGSELAAAAGKPAEAFEYKLLATEELNAMALPDGRVYLTKGLYERLGGRSDAIAFVLGHEITHVTKHHHRKQAKANLAGLIGGAVLGAVLTDKIGGDREDNVRTGAQLGAGIWGGKYSRKDEYKADAGAIDLMVKAGYDPAGAVEAMEAIRARYGRGDAGIPIIGWFASHPDTGDRIKRIRKKISELTPHGGALAFADQAPYGHSELSEESRGVQDDGKSWEGDTKRGGDRRPGRLEPGRPGRPRQRIAVVIEDASSQRGSIRYGSRGLFFYGSPAETLLPKLEEKILETGRFVISRDARILAKFALTDYAAYKGKRQRGEIALGDLLGTQVTIGANSEVVVAILKAELRIETAEEETVWGKHISATEASTLKGIEIRAGRWYSAGGGRIEEEWWRTPAGKAAEEACAEAAKELALLDFSELQELSVFIVAAVRGDKIYVTTDGSLQVGDRLVAAGGPITHPETGEVIGYETGGELEITDATQPRLAVARVVEGEAPEEGAPLFKKTTPRPGPPVGGGGRRR